MKRSILIAAAFTILGILPSQAVNIADLENARGYAYLYRMNGQNYTQNNALKLSLVKVINLKLSVAPIVIKGLNII